MKARKIKSANTHSVICLEKLDEGTPVRHLPCRHLFHTPCIDQWFRSQRYTCPICIAPYL
ncbi:hypothetical protein IMZ48_04770 [Candidatus Bathyarchaeota archaeon]|nr:hypothetical protein [Candidatus Bathyarchaeota archaeon]